MWNLVILFVHVMATVARLSGPGERCDEMNEKNDQIAHFIIVTKSGIAWGFVTN